MVNNGTVYDGRRSEAQRQLLDRVTSATGDINGQLRELRQAAHQGARSADVDAVKSALFAAYNN